MTTSTHVRLDRAGLLAEAARLCADDPEAALSRLLPLAESALGHCPGAVFGNRAGTLDLVAGEDQEDFRSAAAACLRAYHLGQPMSQTEHFTTALAADGDVLGVWVAVPPADRDDEHWKTMSEFLPPFLTIGLRQTRWRREVDQSREQAERRIREVGTFYEVGQAMDRVEIDRLLDMITEKVTRVMEAQACSLLLKLPDSHSMVIAASYGLPDDVVENTRIFVGQGIAGQVAATGEPSLLHSLDDDPRFKNMAGVPGVTSSICMPMKDESGVQGVLCIRRRAPSPAFTDEDLRLFSIFATQVSLVVNNARLYATLNHKLQELSTLAELTETISSSLDLDQVLNQVADNLVDVVHFDRCRIYLSDPATGRFVPHIVRGFPHRMETTPGENTARAGVVELVARRQTPILVEDVRNTLPALRAYGEELGVDSYYAQPIVARGRSIGVLVVSNTGPHRPTTRESIELLSMFVHQAGFAIENARLYASQERRYEEIKTLYEVSSTLAATSGVQTAAETVNELAIKITDSDAGLLLLFDEAGEGLRALHWRGVSDAVGQALRAYTSPVPALASARTLQAPIVVNREEAVSLFGPEWEPLRRDFLSEYRDTAVVPLTLHEAPIGFLVLGKRNGEYSAGALTLIAAASSQAAAVLASAQSYERRIGQRELELSAVRDLMQRVRAAMTLEEALNSILDIVVSLVWSDESALLTVDEDNTTVTVRAARGVGAAEKVGRQTLPLDGDSLAAQALRASNPVIASQTAEGMGHLSQLALPLIVGDEPVGVLTMESWTPEVFTEENVKMLHLVASQAATIYREMSSLRALTRYTDNILRSIAAGVITFDKNGQIVTWNRRAEEIVGLRAQQIVGRGYGEFIRMLQVEPEVRNETRRMLELTAQTGKVFTRNQLCYRSAQGDETYVNLSASQLRSESGEYLGVVVVFEDITNEVQMKEEVERVRKLAETGQLAANIAHELRNPLSSIKGAAQLLRNELPADYVSQHGEFLDIIVEEVNGLNRMTSEFLEFSRATPPRMQSVDVNLIIGRLLQFMGPHLSTHEVTVCSAFDEELPSLWADKSQLEQVIRNIVINAVQAMPQGGYLTVATRYFPSSQIAELSFTDTGVGISAEKMEKIWTPFFTTKTKGTGLGLAIARKIVETHGGRLSVRSEPGEGSTFIIHLPVGPFPTDPLPQARTEMTDERSDRPGEIVGMTTPYPSDL